MLRWVAIGVGLVCVLGVMGASMSMNFLFGYGFGTTTATSRVWGGLSVAADGLKAVLPVLIACQLASRRWGRAALGAVIFLIALAYGFMSAVGFSGQSRSLFTLERENAQAAFEEAKADLKKKESDLAGRGKLRLAAEIQGEIDVLQRNVLWDASRSCRKAISDDQRKLCQQSDKLRAELGAVADANALRASIEILKTKRSDARAHGGAQAADYQVAALKWLFPVDAEGAAKGLNWLAAVLVEMVSAFGFLVVEQARETETVTRKDKPDVGWQLVGESGS